MVRWVLALMAALTLATAAQAADRYATNDGVKIHYVVEGKGPLVVLIHGFPDYWATWKPLMAELNKAGYRTAALDTRGYNLSDKPQGVAAYAMPNLIGDVAAVMRDTAWLVAASVRATVASQARSAPAWKCAPAPRNTTTRTAGSAPSSATVAPSCSSSTPS